MGMAPVTIFGEDLTGHCDGFSSNRLTNIKSKLRYNILDQFTGDLVSHLPICTYNCVLYSRKFDMEIIIGSYIHNLGCKSFQTPKFAYPPN